MAFLTGTDLAGAGVAGFGADFTTDAAAGLADADFLLRDVAGTGGATALETGFLAGGAVLARGADDDVCAPFFTVLEDVGEDFFAGTALETAAFFAGADLVATVLLAAATFFAAVFFVAAAFETGAFFTGVPFETAPFPAGAVLAADVFFAAGVATVVLDAGLAVLAVLVAGLAAGRVAAAFLAVPCPAAFFAAGLLTLGFAAARETVFAAFLVATGLAVFLAALTAFFADFLAATKRSSLDSPGPGKAGLYSLPCPQQQPRDRMLTGALLHWPDGIPDTVRKPCGREPGRWRGPPAWPSCKAQPTTNVPSCDKCRPLPTCARSAWGMNAPAGAVHAAGSPQSTAYVLLCHRDFPPAHRPAALLQALHQSPAGAALPFLSKLFGIRHAGHFPARRAAGWLAGDAAPWPLPSLPPGWAGSGSGSPAFLFLPLHRKTLTCHRP